jgi:Transposase, Mutator family
VHLIRAAMRFVNWKQRKAVAAALKPIYQAADADAARIELEAFKASELGRSNPHTIATFERSWAGSPDVLPHRGPLRTGRASYPRIRLKQAHWRRGMVRSGRCAARPCGRSRCGPGVKRDDRSSVRVAGRR